MPDRGHYALERVLPQVVQDGSSSGIKREIDFGVSAALLERA